MFVFDRPDFSKNSSRFYIKDDLSFMVVEWSRRLFDQVSPYQHIKIFETKKFGNTLILDNILMSCEKDEFIYHEMVSHVPLFSHPRPRDVLIIGGGEGGTAREVLRHPGLNQCVMAEIDPLVISACKQYMKSTAVSFSHPGLDLKIGDGAVVVAGYKNSFDCIIVDGGASLAGPSGVLYSGDFYKNCFRALRQDGIMVSCYENLFQKGELTHRDMLQRMKEAGFCRVGVYSYSNVSFPPGLWSVLFASKGPHPIKDFKPERVKKSGLPLRYYNEEIHTACFSRAEFIKKDLSGVWTL